MKRYISFLFLFLAAIPAFAFDLTNPPVHCPQDTALATRLVRQLAASGLPKGKRLVEAAGLLQGAVLDSYYRTDSIGQLRINLEEFTPLSFVNTVMALAEASEAPGMPSWKNFAQELERLSCRRGENTGFPSILFHGSDWIADNVFRGNVKELTEDYFGGVVVRTKSLDEMTRNRSNYAALADSAAFERVRMTEMGFRTHRIPTMKKETIEKKEILEDLQDGDIILLVPSGDGIDLYDIGFVALREDGPHLIHLSPKTKTVVEEPETLQRYMKLMTKYFQGYRLLRPL